VTAGCEGVTPPAPAVEQQQQQPSQQQPSQQQPSQQQQQQQPQQQPSQQQQQQQPQQQPSQQEPSQQQQQPSQQPSQQQQQQQQRGLGVITLVASTKLPQRPGCPQAFRLRVPRLPGYFTGTGEPHSVAWCRLVTWPACWFGAGAGVQA
jgi:hypothetical protein